MISIPRRALSSRTLPIATLVLLATLAACTSKSTAGGAATKTIGVTLLTRGNEFYLQLENGMRRSAERHGYKLVLTSGDRDLAKQQSQIDNFIVQHVDAIILCPVDSKGIGPAIEKANAARIPVFTSDIGAEGGHVVSHIASDNVAGGRLAADYIAKAIGGHGDVGLMGETDVQSTVDREAGFREGLRKYPGITLAAALDGGGVRDRALKTADDMLQAHPNLAAIFAINDESAFGTLSSIQSRRKTSIVLVGYDADAEAQQAIVSGTALKADVAQDPRLMGERTIDVIADYFGGKTPAARIAIPVRIIDADSVRALRAAAKP